MQQNKKGLEAYGRADWAAAASYFQQALRNRPGDAAITHNLADALGHLANMKGLQARERREWAASIAYFEEAVRQLPNDAVARQNLADARVYLTNATTAANNAIMAENEAWLTSAAEISTAQARAAEASRNQALADRIQEFVQNFADTLKVAPLAGGLDFAATLPAPSASPSNDPRVVNAQHVPSGLETALDEAIVGAFSRAPAGVSDRVRKGFQAVMNRDWQVARAWFEDALQRDPDNVGLQRLVVEATGSTPKPKRAVPPGAVPPNVNADTGMDEPFFLDFPSNAAARIAQINAERRSRPPSPDDVYYCVPTSGCNVMWLEEAESLFLHAIMFDMEVGSIVEMSGRFPRDPRSLP